VECGNLIPVNREENVFHPPDQVLSCASLDAGERRDARLENRDSVSPVPLDWMSMAGKARFSLTRALAVLGAVTGLTALVLVLVGGIPSSVQPPSLPIGLPSGTSISASPPTDPATRAITLNGLASMQLYDVVAVKFNALMSFSFTGTTVDHPADFSVLQIPITWTDTSFIGQRQDISPGTNILYLAEGRVSPDGLRLLSLVYSRKVNQDAGNGSFYRVTLSDLPLTNVIKEASEGKGVYEKKGADLKNNVIKIEYVDGQRSEGQMDSLTTFIGADWTSTNPVPALKLTFSKAGGTPDEAAAM
jgi:hypothetical protein